MKHVVVQSHASLGSRVGSHGAFGTTPKSARGKGSQGNTFEVGNPQPLGPSPVTGRKMNTFAPDSEKLLPTTRRAHHTFGDATYLSCDKDMKQSTFRVDYVNSPRACCTPHLPVRGGTPRFVGGFSSLQASGQPWPPLLVVAPRFCFPTASTFVRRLLDEFGRNRGGIRRGHRASCTRLPTLCQSAHRRRPALHRESAR